MPFWLGVSVALALTAIGVYFLNFYVVLLINFALWGKFLLDMRPDPSRRRNSGEMGLGIMGLFFLPIFSVVTLLPSFYLNWRDGNLETGLSALKNLWSFIGQFLLR